MKAKTLLIAAAALAAATISSEAQVYSQNVVGYVNVVAPAGKYVLIANPLTTGNDVVTNVLQGLPGGTAIQYWNGAGFDTYTYSALQKHWKNGAVIGDNLSLAPGIGFFLINSTTSITNTFVGSIVASSGGATTNALGTTLNPVASAIPYADVVTNAATINLAVGGGSGLQQWDTASQQFNSFTYSALAKSWKLGTVSSNPVVQVGEAFFLNASAPTNWVQKLQ